MEQYITAKKINGMSHKELMIKSARRMLGNPLFRKSIEGISYLPKAYKTILSKCEGKENNKSFL